MILAVVAADPTPVWLTVLLGIGVGTLAASLVAGIVTVWNAQQQREHELRIRAQQFAHESELENVRDRQRLRDARLERLREDLREIVLIAFDMQKTLMAIESSAPIGEIDALIDNYSARFYAVCGRLLLDPLGPSIVQQTDQLENELKQYQSMSARLGQLTRTGPKELVADYGNEVIRQRELVLGMRQEVAKQAQDILANIEHNTSTDERLVPLEDVPTPTADGGT